MILDRIARLLVVSYMCVYIYIYSMYGFSCSSFRCHWTLPTLVTLVPFPSIHPLPRLESPVAFGRFRLAGGSASQHQLRLSSPAVSLEWVAESLAKVGYIVSGVQLNQQGGLTLD